jgi:arabinan endo-1,5-alpha-L-arabinosidase
MTLKLRNKAPAVGFGRVAAGAMLLGLLACALPAAEAPPLRGNIGAHDPSTIIKCKDRYYLFATGEGILSKSSADKVYWTGGPAVFSSVPAWTTAAVPGFGGTFWAPDVMFLNGRYCLYYAVSTFGSQVSAIGLATNPTLDPADPAYHWTDQGPVIVSTNGSPFNTIDPSVTRDASGNPWMAFGSYWNGIYMVQLDPLTGLRISPNSPTTRVAYNGSIEAACIFRRGGYYYLFANWGSCCSGLNSTYNVRLGRSTSITGPYLDRNGLDMAANGGTLFLQGSGKFTGPGHIGVLSENGSQSFSYHYYDAGAYAPWYGAYGIADFDFEPLSWTADDWPVFTNDWSAVYQFQADARDEHGQYYGLLNGAAVQNDPTYGRVLNLSGTNQFVQLPPGLGFARTFSAILKWNGGGDWQRIFDFGVDTSRYVMLTPSGAGKFRCDIRANGVTQIVSGPSALPVGTWVQVALTLDGQKGTLYLNGAPVATNAISLSPLDVRAQTNHLGRSKFVADPDFRGQIASFRVWGRALSAAEIAAPEPSITQPEEGATYSPGAPVSFSGSAKNLAGVTLGAASLSWRVEYLQDGRTNLVYGPVSGVTNGTFLPGATGGGIYRIALSANDGLGHQAVTFQSLPPANPAASSSSYYPFRVDASDANGHFDGTLNGGASIQNDPTRGNVLSLSGNNQFVSLPPAAANLRTFMAWVKWNGGGAWQRIFDFGNDTTHYSVLTPSAANGKLRFNISVNSIAGEQIIDGPGPLPIGVWTHVAVTFDGNGGVLYTNGQPVATNAFLNLVPANLNPTNLYLGKSQWPDPYFNGMISSARTFSRALSASEIVAPVASIFQPIHGAIYHPGDTIQFSGAAADFYDATLSPTGLSWTVQFRNGASTNTVLGPLAGATNGSFAIPANGPAATNGFYRIILIATDSVSRRTTNFADIFPGGAIDTAGEWASYYPFTSNAFDASNRYNGTLIGGASIQNDAVRGNVLNLSGNNQYVSFPAGIGTLRTFAAWVKWRGGPSWQRVFDFGQDTQRFFFLTPSTSGAKLQCALTAEAASYVQVMETTPLPTNVWTHLAVTLDGRQGILYVNGQAVAVNNSVNLLPADIASTKNYFGKSQFAADAYFNGQLDSVKINSKALTVRELTAPVPVILQPTPGTLYEGGGLVSFSGKALDYTDAPLPASTFSWTSEFHHDGQTDPVFGPLTGATNGSFQVPTSGPASTNVFYRVNLMVTDATGNSSMVWADVLPRTSWLDFNTVPPGLALLLDGQTLACPTSVVSVVGLTRTLSAPPTQSLAASNYNFVLWSDGGAAVHAINVPATGASFTASYVAPTMTVQGGAGGLDLAWPAWAGALRLYSASNLSPSASWVVVTNPPLASNGLLTLSVAVTNGSRFFRLRSE